MAVTLLVMAAAGVATLFMTPLYTASVTLLSQGENNLDGLPENLTSETGAPLSVNSSLEVHFLEILRSDRVLDLLIARKWAVQNSDQPQDLYAIYGIAGPNEAGQGSTDSSFRLKETLRRKTIFMYRNRVTGYMDLRVTVPGDPQLAADIANFLVDQLRVFIRQFRGSKASRQQEFITNRLNVVEPELEAAEAAVTDFILENPDFNDSPQLRQSFGVLERDLEAVTTVWVELQRQLELARIEENKYAMAVDVLDMATPPQRRSHPNLVLNVLFSGFLAFMVGCAVIFGRDQWSRWR